MSKNAAIRCLIVDDEPLAQEILTDYVERIPYLHLVGSARNSEQALEACRLKEPDLVLLDIRMPGLNGFELLNKLPKPGPFVVVTTAFREYALTGYEHNVVDFLAKPIFYDRFQQAIKRVEDRMNLTAQKTNVSLNDGDGSVSLTSNFLSMRNGRDQTNIPLDSINYIESMDNYVKIHLTQKNTKPDLFKMTVTRLESELPSDSFIRINRKYIIRKDQVQKINAQAIVLFNGIELPIGVTFRDSVRQRLLVPSSRPD